MTADVPGLIDEQITTNGANQINGAKLNAVLKDVAQAGTAIINVNNINTKAEAYEDAATARDAVPESMRKAGAKITYLLAAGWMEDQFNGADISGWDTASNWKTTGPVSVSQNTLSIGGEEEGELFCQLIENPEWIWAATVNGNRFLFGFRKEDGSPYFGFGCPPQVIDYVTERLGSYTIEDYESMKSFIGEFLDDTTLKALLDKKFDGEYIENPEYVWAFIDKNKKLLEGQKKTGERLINTPIETPTVIIRSINNPEWMEAHIDKNGRLVVGIREDGEMVWGKLPKQIQDYVLSKIAQYIGIPSTITPYFSSCKIYTTCNDIKSSDNTSINSRNYSARVYIDHLYRDLSQSPKTHIEGKKNFLPLYSKYEIGYQTKYINSNTNNQIKDLDTYVNDVKIIGDLVNEEHINITHISTRNLATANKAVRLLCIGDSVTCGANANVNKPYANAPETYWEWVKALFEMDRMENNNEGFFCETLGNFLSGPPDYYGSSWETQEHHIFDLNFNGFTKNNIMACAIARAGGRVQWFLESQSGQNPLWDSVNNKFSLNAWISNYRTLVVNADGTTTRCTDANKGALVTDVNAYNVCEPTHVLIAFGYNQSYSSPGTTRTDYLNALNTMITSIKSEFPDTVILLQLPDTAGTYFPELYPEYMQENNDLYGLDFTKGVAKDYHNRFAVMNKDLMDLEDIDNNIYYVPAYFVSPLCYGSASRIADDMVYLSAKAKQLKTFVESGTNSPYFHPNNAAHAAWAYQIYSIIKKTLV